MTASPPALATPRLWIPRRLWICLLLAGLAGTAARAQAPAAVPTGHLRGTFFRILSPHNAQPSHVLLLPVLGCPERLSPVVLAACRAATTLVCSYDLSFLTADPPPPPAPARPEWMAGRMNNRRKYERLKAYCAQRFHMSAAQFDSTSLRDIAALARQQQLPCKSGEALPLHDLAYVLGKAYGKPVVGLVRIPEIEQIVAANTTPSQLADEALFWITETQAAMAEETRLQTLYKSGDLEGMHRHYRRAEARFTPKLFPAFEKLHLPIFQQTLQPLLQKGGAFLFLDGYDATGPAGYLALMLAAGYVLELVPLN